MLMHVQLPSPFHLFPEQSLMDCPQSACLLLFFHMKPLVVFVISDLFIASILLNVLVSYTYIMHDNHIHNYLSQYNIKHNHAIII